jgi:hypothetical protein
MNLRDHFAARFAAALVDAFPEPERIARRAYDLAEAMLAERARRIDADERRAIEAEQGADDSEAPPHSFGPLLDEPHPLFDRDEDLDLSSAEPHYDPSWDAELLRDERRSYPPDSASDSSRPGLARTRPGVTEVRRERSA